MSTANYTKGRTGWNARGPSPADLAREAARLDSDRWQRKAEHAQDKLVAKIGPEAYLAWAEETWPGTGVSSPSIERCTWEQIYGAVNAKLTEGAVA